MVGWMHKKDIPLLYKIGISIPLTPRNLNMGYTWSIDYVIDRMRTKYNVVIYHKSTPFVDASGKIIYNFAAKCCNPKMGWNGRTYIDTPSKWDSNIYEAKRRAIRAAARWILAHKCQKISIKPRKNGKSKERKN